MNIFGFIVVNNMPSSHWSGIVEQSAGSRILFHITVILAAAGTLTSEVVVFYEGFGHCYLWNPFRDLLLPSILTLAKEVQGHSGFSFVSEKMIQKGFGQKPISRILLQLFLHSFWPKPITPVAHQLVFCQAWGLPAVLLFLIKSYMLSVYVLCATSFCSSIFPL